jgi:hypothetical protein
MLIRSDKNFSFQFHSTSSILINDYGRFEEASSLGLQNITLSLFKLETIIFCLHSFHQQELPEVR